jgi:hypothetical protein
MSRCTGRRKRKAIPTIGALAVLALALGACGGEERQGADDGRSKAAAGELEEYCAATLAIETAQSDVDFETLTPEQQAEQSKKFATETLRPLADRINAAAPERIKEDLEVADRSLAEAERTGDFTAAFRQPDKFAAFNRLHAFDLESCGWERVDVTAAEYRFDGVPASIPAGETSFEFENQGKEAHEMVLFRRKDGEAMTFDQILAIEDQSEAEKHMDFIAGTGGDPGSDEPLYAVTDLQAGDYVMVCFIPVGSTPEALRAAQEASKPIEGRPHFTEGMKAELKVT